MPFSGDVLIYFHNSGEFLRKKLRSEMNTFPSINYIMQVELEISVSKVLSMREIKCVEETYSYDSCILNSNLEAMREKCVPPFAVINQTGVESLCTNFTEGEEALTVFQQSPQTCKPSCFETVVKLNMVPVDVLFPTLNPNSPSSTPFTGYLFRVPTKVVSSTIFGTYTIVSLIAEFGGWMGLLLGLSILGVMNHWWGKCDEKLEFSKVLKITPKLLMYLVSLVFIGLVFGRALLRMLYKETGLDVNIEETNSDLSISFCSMESVYLNQTSKDGKFELVYVGNSSSIWNTDMKLRSKIEFITAELRNGTIINIYKEQYNMSQYILYSTNIPRLINYFENCHTLDLKFGVPVKKLSLVALKEFTIYVHKTGQLLNMDLRHGFNYVNSQSMQTRIGRVFVYSTRLKLSIELLSLGAVQYNAYSLNSTFDDCVLDTMSKEEETEAVKPTSVLKLNELGLNNVNLTELEFTKLRKGFQQENIYSFCDYPSEIAKISYAPEVEDSIFHQELINKLPTPSKGKTIKTNQSMEKSNKRKICFLF